MKNAFRWIITIIGIMCITFFVGMFFGRRSMTPAANYSPTAFAETTTNDVLQININTADFDELLTLPGIGETIAQRIIDFTSGSTFAIDGNLQKISNYIFIITPSTVEVSGDFLNFMDSFESKGF